MKDLLLFIMGAAGITIIISASLLFKPLREIFNNKYFGFVYKLITCTMCLGVWVALIMVWLHDNNPEVFKYTAYAGASSLFAWAAYKSVN